MLTKLNQKSLLFVRLLTNNQAESTSIINMMIENTSSLTSLHLSVKATKSLMSNLKIYAFCSTFYGEKVKEKLHQTYREHHKVIGQYKVSGR